MKKTLGLRVSAGMLTLLLPWFAGAASLAEETLQNYKRAARFQDARKLVARTSLNPNWIGNSDRFWYLDDYRKIRTFMLVDPSSNSQRPAFDHKKLAAGLSEALGQSYAADALPFSAFEYIDEGKPFAVIRLTVGERDWRCELRSYSCTKALGSATARQGEIVSPNGRWAVFLKDYNFWVRDTLNDEQTALTNDGIKNFGYGNGDTTTYSVTDSVLKAGTKSRY